MSELGSQKVVCSDQPVSAVGMPKTLGECGVPQRRPAASGLAEKLGDLGPSLK